MYYPLDDPTAAAKRRAPGFRNYATLLYGRSFHKPVNQRAKKYRRLFCRLAIGFIILFLVTVITGLTIFDHQHNNIVLEYLAQEDDLVILSATYYKNSKSFPNNTVVLLLNAHQVFQMKHKHLTVVSSNEKRSETTSLEIRQVVGMVPFYCKWVPFIAVGQLVPNANWLEFNAGQDGLGIEMRVPYKESHQVVTCFSPLFMNENWELLLLTAEVYSHYGAFLHFYVRSMVKPLFDILEKYPNSRTVPWPAVKIGAQRASSSRFNPNLELEFRNQASAMTDCLLLYKESAEYIMFPDPDDLIVPRMSSSYYGEFNKLFAMHPTAATIAYNMTQTTLSASFDPKEYSPADVLRSIRFTGDKRSGKLVVRPELVDSVWINASYDVRDGWEQISVPVANNSALHLRFWSIEAKVAEMTMSKYNPNADKRIYGNDLILPTDLERIESSFRQRVTDNEELYDQLPAYSVYYPLIEKCYNRIFYNGESHSKCKGPELCDIPQFPGIKCTNVEAKFETFTKLPNIYIHHLKEVKFVQSDNGCTL